MQWATGGISLLIYYSLRGLYFLAWLFGHIVRSVMHDQKFFTQGLNILSKSWPWLLELWFVGSSALIFLILLIIAGSLIVFTRRYASYNNSIYAMMDMIVAWLLFIFILNSPHLAVFCCGSSFYYTHIALCAIILAMEKRLQIQSCILTHKTNTCPLTTAESLRDFRHLETPVFPFPIV